MLGKNVFFNGLSTYFLEDFNNPVGIWTFRAVIVLIVLFVIGFYIHIQRKKK